MLYRDHFSLNWQLSKEEVMIQLEREGINLPDEDIDVVWNDRGSTAIWVITKTESYMNETKAAIERIDTFLKLVDRIEKTQRMRRPRTKRASNLSHRHEYSVPW